MSTFRTLHIFVHVALLAVSVRGNPDGDEETSKLTFADIDVFGCSADTVGFGLAGHRKESGDSLVTCGVTLLRGALAGTVLPQFLDVFLQMPQERLAPLQHGHVREKRLQTHLPFEAPFDALNLLGSTGQLAGPLLAALGKDFVLDLATVVQVPAGADYQDPHRDTAVEGSVAAHIPLHHLEESAAPLSFCAGTHRLGGDATRLVVREAILYRGPGESSQEAKRRLYCGGHQRTESFRLSVKATVAKEIRVRDSKLGVDIKKIYKRAEGLQWKVGDSLTHADGQRINHTEDWDELVEAAIASKKAVELRVERPLPGGPPKEPPLLVVGAPLDVGDVVLYDSRIFHWGMKNYGKTSRYVLYVNFKSSANHEGVHPEAHGTAELKKAREAFQKRVVQLRKEFSGATEL